ncbi:50S ribosomal protein L5 [Candidatus Uhrbacteria bacterium]|nr:50S ribosomal protein L5 [Candidatus Uhrbacteria bacterium]
MATMKEKYLEAVPKLKEELKLSNVNAVPKLEKVTLNVGLGKGLKDKAYTETVEKTLEQITGQKPVFTKARKSIATFKIREGMPVGIKVTLRGPRMYDFIEKLVNVTFPRIRDFRGIELKSVDSGGNFNFGFKEHIAFPEVSAVDVDKLHGLQVTITTTAQSKAEGEALFKALGFPFKKIQN